MFTPRLFKIKMHTRRVLIFKRTLPVFAFFLAALMIAWPTLLSQKEQFALAVKTNKNQATSDVDMERVRFFAQDRKNQPLTVTAPKVRETDPERQIVTLFEPVAVYKMQSGVTLNARTTYGLAFQKEEYLYFEEEVTATTDTGYTARATRILCDYNIDKMESESPVFVDGPTGRLHAEGFVIYNKGNNIDFKGETDTLVYSVEGNIHVQSEDGLLIDQVPQTITARKNVVITQNDKTITADKAVMVYNTSSQNMDNRIARLDVMGHVSVTSPTHKMTGDKGMYDPRSETLQMTGNVVLYQGPNRLEGESAVVNLKTGESTLVPRQNPNTNQPERIRGQLLPSSLN